MTTLHSGDIGCPTAPLLSIPSARLRSLILKKHLTALNAQLKTDQKTDIAQNVSNLSNYTNQL